MTTRVEGAEGRSERGRITDRQAMLLQAGLALSSDLSLPVVLQRIVELAVQVTAARYGALGVLGPDGRISEFVTTGLTEEERDAIGPLPTGGGILGALIDDPRPLRLRDIGDDPRSVGFPRGHPPMRSFLGASVMARGRVFGNIYLTEKQGADEFSAEDEESLVMLAAQAGVAVENARLYEETSRRERWLEALHEIRTAILSGAQIDDVLRLVAARARELAGADGASVAVPHDDGQTLVVKGADGLKAEELLGQEIPVKRSVSGQVIRTGKPVVLDDASIDTRVHQPFLKLVPIGPVIFAPLVVRGGAFGTLAVGRVLGSEPFREEEVQAIETFAAEAAVAVEYERAQQELKRLLVLEDRERIAKELHDGSIQSLFAVGMGLQATAEITDDERVKNRVESAVAELDRVIRDLRNYIFGLRPGILAGRGLADALARLTSAFEERTGIVAVSEADPAVADWMGSRGGDVVQLAREALSNVGKHAGAQTCRVSLRAEGGHGVLEIDDDGAGFDLAEAEGRGQGLGNLRDRARSMGGSLEIETGPGRGTTVRVRIPR